MRSVRGCPCQATTYVQLEDIYQPKELCDLLELDAEVQSLINDVADVAYVTGKPVVGD